MANIFAFGAQRQKTSAAMITTVADVFTASGVRQSTPSSATIITTAPTFAGVQSVVAQLNGSLLVNWNAATGPNGPYIYDVYVQESTNVGLFNPSNVIIQDNNLSCYAFELSNGNLLRGGFTYYVGVKARDPLRNVSTNISILSAVSSGVAPGRPLTPADIGTVVSAIWDELASGHNIGGSFGQYLDAQVSSRATQSSLNNIPTNPLLTNDTRLNNLDAAVSSRSTQTSVDNINTKVGTPVGTIASDIGSVQSTSNTINSKIGTPVTSVSGDIAAVKVDTNSIDTKVDANVSTRSTQTSVNNIDSKIGTPNTTVSGDINAVKVDTAAVKLQTDKFSFDGLNYVNSRTKVNEDKVGYSISSGSEDSIVDKVWDESKAGHVSSGSFGESNQGILSIQRANNLDNLDATVSSRATQTSVNAVPTNPLLTNDSRLNNLDATISSRASQASVDGIQNNTDFIAIVPTALLLPQTGSKTYPMYVRLFNDSGSPVDPDSSIMNLSIKDASGATVVASVNMTRSAVGQYVYNYVVNSSDTEQALFVFFDYVKNSVAFNQVRATEVVEYESKLDTLLSRLTPTRATNLDNLDATVSSRATQVSVDAVPTNPLLVNDSRLNNLDATISSRASQSTVNTVDSKLGTPVTSVSADIAAIKTDSAAINTKVDVTVSSRASQATINIVNTKIGTPVTTVSGDIAAVQADTDSIDTKVDVTVSSRASQASVDAVPTAGENADAVWEENVNDHATGTTTARTLKDAKIFSQIDL